ncbi:aspartyl protease family protein At5g10770-like [Neltuma alba]|uniref:aspartyl protease family protein At5g10770-like n=1 Tax=Neltuma alba TaxID=207710 RepID=UPI0010A3202C|nr:aspartyl protease family protein At5g10770-like [Prosopis alba]
MASHNKYCFFFASVLGIIIFNNEAAIEEEIEAIGNQQWLTVSLSSLFPSSTSSPNFTGLKKKSSLEVMQRHGPCCEEKHNGAEPKSPTHTDILSEDQERVNSIHSKLSKGFGHENMKQPDSASIPARSGVPIGSGGYIVTVGLGYRQCANSTQTCIYNVEYVDTSSSVGFLSKERLTIAADTFDNFLFGCGQNNRGDSYGGAAGILGLGRHPISFVQQTANTYNKVFSYCLPSTPSSVGHLTFGSGEVPKNVQYTPITTIPNLNWFYGINIIGITVGGTTLSSATSTLSSAKAIIDVGTTITRLPPSVYAALRSEFQQKMAMYPMASELVILDTCYDLSGYETVCLAFAPNKREEDVLILGNVQQKTIEVVHDLNAERLGFGPPGGCK